MINGERFCEESNKLIKLIKLAKTVVEIAIEKDEVTGVGLVALVKRIINKHNGHIWSESVINKSSTFYFTVS